MIHEISGILKLSIYYQLFSLLLLLISQWLNIFSQKIICGWIIMGNITRQSTAIFFAVWRGDRLRCYEKFWIGTFSGFWFRHFLRSSKCRTCFTKWSAYTWWPVCSFFLYLILYFLEFWSIVCHLYFTILLNTSRLP